MKNFFKKHPEVLLVGLAVVFVAVLATYFFWGITNTIAVLDRAVNAGATEKTHAMFDIQGAKGLNLKGLVQ